MNFAVHTTLLIVGVQSPRTSLPYILLWTPDTYTVRRGGVMSLFLFVVRFFVVKVSVRFVV